MTHEGVEHIESAYAQYGADGALIAPDAYFQQSYPDTKVVYGRMPIPMTIGKLLALEDTLRRYTGKERATDQPERRTELYIGMLAAADAVAAQDQHLIGLDVQAIAQRREQALRRHGLVE